MRRFFKAHWRRFAAVSASCCAVALSSGAAHAVTLACGDTVGPGTIVVVDADVTGCAGAGTPALTIQGPVTLDMGGHEVRCASMNPADGIHVVGDHVRIQNGSVRACGYGVLVEGGGKHTLSGVNVNANLGRGIDVTSDRNTLTRCSATSNSAAEGFRIASDRNRIDHCVATNNATGLVLDGDGNRLVESEAVASAGATGFGFDIGGSTNQVSRCAATSNDQAGFSIAGTENKIRENHATRNTQEGFEVTGTGNSLAQNIAARNGTHGFALTAVSGTDLDANLAISNASQGIDVSGSNNEITRNHAVNNGLSGIQFTGAGTGNSFEANVAMQSTNNDVRDTTACAGACHARGVLLSVLTIAMRSATGDSASGHGVPS